MWSPSIIIMVASLGSIDLSSIITAASYARKIDCERDVRIAVLAMKNLYPTLNIKFSACVKAGQ